MNKLSVIISSVALILSLACATICHNVSSKQKVIEQELILSDMQFMLTTPEDGLLSALKFFEIDSAEWVFCQAIAETNNGNAGVGKSKNNLFGIYNSQKREFESYDYWWESVLDYKTRIQSKFDPEIDESYPDFLNRIGYAESHDYISKLKSLHKQYFE